MDLVITVVIAAIAVLVGVILSQALGKKKEPAQTAPVQSVAAVATPVAPVETVIADMPAQSSAVSSAALAEARAKATEIVVEAKSQALKLRTEAEEESRKTRERAVEMEKKLTYIKGQLEAKEKELQNKAATLEQSRTNIEKKQEEINAFHAKQQEELQKISGLTKDEAKKALLQSFDKELSEEKGQKIRQQEEDIKKDADKIAKDILINTMRFAASDYVVEYTTSRVKLTEEEIKGRIIGKEGRNIKTFEELTGVDLDMDSSPGDVIISCFDPVRREIAKISLERLMADGRIQPAHIEEVIEKVRGEVDQIMYKEGDNLAHKVGAYNVPKDIIQMLGRFKYRFSYGQNMIEHTLEETRLGVALAYELGANVDIVRLGCLFHDIGKVVTDDEGTHVTLGVELLRKYKISEDVINCVAEHHEDRPFSSVESAIVQLSDHISGARPGARSEDYESYVKRLKDLEEAALSFHGVDKAYAVSAGREVRVFVSPEKVNDASTAFLAREIAKKIELEQTYPGVVKVIVIRETRVIETAK
jgi:ribonuclease Y